MGQEATLKVLTKERIKYLDVAKGMFMLLILLCHLPDAADVYGVELPYSEVLTKWQSLYTAFFMQAFFFISGYCSNFNKGFGDFFVSLIKRIALPIIYFTILISVVDALFFSSWQPLLELQKPLFWLKGWHVWFLYAIFVAKCAIWLIIRIKIRNELRCVLLLALMCGGFWLNDIAYKSNYLCAYHAMIALLFIWIGHWMSKNDGAYRFSLQYLGWLYPIVLVLTKLLHYDIPTVTWGLHVSLSLIPLFLITSLTGTFLALNFCRQIKENKFLELWGRNSLLIYGLNYSSLGLASAFVYKLFCPDNIVSGVVAIMTVLCIVVLFCSIICFFSSRKTAEALA